MKVIKFQYGGQERIIKYDGIQFTPRSTNLTKVEGEVVEGQDVLGYFKSFGGAVKKIIDHGMGSKEEELSLLAFVTRYELAVKEIVSLKEEDFEF